MESNQAQKAYLASETYMSKAKITQSSLDPNALQKMILYLVIASLSGAISSSLSVS